MSTAALSCALAAAASWAVASISLSRVLERGAVSPAAANLFKNGVAASFFLVLALAGDGRWPVGEAWLWLFGSGLLGFALSDTLYFAAFRRCGVQTAATVMLLNVPIATVLSVPMVGDALDGGLLALMAVVLAGVLIVTLDGRGVEDPEGHRIPARTRAVGVLLAVGAATAIGTAVPLGRGRFEGVDVFTGGFVRLLGGAAGAVPLALLSGLGRATSPGRELRRLVEPLLIAPGPASVWGRASLIGVGCAVLGLLPYHFAMRELPGGLAAVLFSSTPLFTLPLCLLIGQRVGPLAIVGTGVGFVGVAAILLGGHGGAPETPARLEVAPAPLAGPTSARFPMFVEGAQVEGLPPAVVTARAADAGTFRLVLLGDRSASVASERTVAMESAGGPDGDRRYFVNWADVPRAARLGSGALLAATLERLGESTYAYGVRLTLEEDGPPGRDLGWLHDDEQPVEHGFVSIVPLRTGGALCVWLDGRAGGEAEGGGGHGHGHGGGMQLRARTVDAGGALGEDVLLDGLVCDCCPTDAVALEDGSVVVVYRDRSEEELRDVWTVRRDPAGAWSEPRPVYRDGWKIEGCPVNGPSVAASGDLVATAWYTEGGRTATPRVRIAFSRDGGVSHGRPVTVEIDGALGRVDLAAAGEGRFVLAYLAAPADAPAAWYGRLVAPGEAPGAPVRIASVDPGRRSGRLSLTSAEDPSAGSGPSIHAVWTVEEGVEAARILVEAAATDDDAGR
ncbi:MAG: DMT family transporter [Planctomycetota bacterium]